ncbi:unnamed protein product [Peniophora sp. CBMAI 1063]|nr:unnamed protein product [Peniophora sp. CBMAI 1063]
MPASRFYCVLLAANLISALSTDDVLWSSPARDSLYHSGDTLTAVWRPSLNKGGGSPSFSMCDQTDHCGDAVWPAVKSSGDGFKEASFVVPNITSEATYHLQMEDDFGSTSISPEFTLSPALPTKNQPEPESSLVVPVDEPAQLPLSDLASSKVMPQDVPSSGMEESDKGLNPWLPVPTRGSPSTIDDTSPGIFPTFEHPWFNGASVFPKLSGDPEQQPDEPRGHLNTQSMDPSSPSGGPPAVIGAAAIAPPMSQVHFPPSSDTSPTPPAPQSQLSVQTHTTPLPVAAIAVPLSFAAVIGIVAFAAIAYNRRKVLRNEAKRAAAVTAINGNMKLLEARNTSFWSRSSVYSCGPSTPTGGADHEKISVLGRLAARWAPSAPPPNVHDEDATQQQDDQVGGLSALQSQKFDEIPLSPAMPPPLHIRNDATVHDMSRFTTSSIKSGTSMDSSPADIRSGGLFDSVSRAFSARHQ